VTINNQSSANNPLKQLIALLGGKDFDLTGEEIADVLWLNLQRQQLKPRSTSVTPASPGVTPPSAETAIPLTSLPPSLPTAEIYPQPLNDNPNPNQTKALPLPIPDAPSLRESLILAQALKPLMRQVESGRKKVLDETATVERTAAEGICIPVLKPEPEPWLELALVVDESKSMLIWRHTINELKKLLEHYGVFRDVRTWTIVLVDTQGKESLRLRSGIGKTSNNQRLSSPSELIDPNGRRVIWVVSDCVAAMWRDGTVAEALKIWAKYQPIAIVQMLPDWLWLRTGLGLGASVRLGSLAAGVANQYLLVKELLLWKDINFDTGIKIPVLTLEPEVALTWSQMVTGKSQALVSGFVFSSEVELPSKVGSKEATPQSNITHVDAEERVYRFRMTASPIARKLAGLLAAAPVINLPVVRLIQETMLGQSRQVNVAEVFLGGLLKPLIEIEADTNPDAVQYDFMDDEIRKILLESAPVSDSAEVINAVSKYVAEQLGKSLQEFVALLKSPGQGDEAQVRPFAEVTTKLLKQLGGDYARFAEEIGQGQVANVRKSVWELFAGDYICAVKWGGESGTWHEGTEKLLLSREGEVRFTSRFGTTTISNWELTENTLSWTSQDNQTAASFTFKNDSEHRYFWDDKQTGKLFEGWLQYPNEGRIDFRGKLIESSQVEQTPQVPQIEQPPRMYLSGKNRKKLCEALIDAYRDVGDLEIFVLEEFEENLTKIVRGRTLSQVVFNLISWAESKGILKKLIEQACEQNPGNEKLQAIKQELIPKPTLQTFEFDVVTVNPRGQEIRREKNTSQYFSENLGNGITLNMVVIPGGTFLMGAPENEEGSDESERPQHQVTISPFCMGTYPVTQAQWQAVASFEQVNRKLKSDPSRFKGENRPVENVSWYDAKEFCDRLSRYTGKLYRLPSESEWEYACRAGTTTPFHFGETITTDLANYAGTDDKNNKWSGSYGQGPKGIYLPETTPVGKFSVANAFGLYDMHGNAWEWCADHWHGSYEGAPNDGSEWIKDKNPNDNDNQNNRLLRGGSWLSNAVDCRSANRVSYFGHFNDYGFRVVCGVAARIP
jgi:formylglycine-generating enzyme required for sulfatase activity